jgi:site-specific DNA-methyltransferase (adenine-specific)
MAKANPKTPDPRPRRARPAASRASRAAEPRASGGLKSARGAAARLVVVDTPLTFFLEDCVEGLARRLDPGSLDVVVTSPPYNLGVRYSSFRDDGPRAQYLEWTERWGAAVAAALAPGGSFFLNIGGRPLDPWGPMEVALVLRRHFVLQNVIHWVKSIALDRPRVAVGHYKPIRGERFVNDCHEYIFHFTHSGDVPLDRTAIGVPYQDKSNVKRWKSAGADLRCRGNTWFVPYETIQNRSRERPHPATFPPRLPEMCLKLHGLARAQLACDPFLGIGNTAVACARLGVPFVGFELDAGYLKEAERRVAAEMRLFR